MLNTAINISNDRAQAIADKAAADAKALADQKAADDKAADDKAQAGQETLTSDRSAGLDTGVKLPDLVTIDAPNLGASGVDLTLTDPNAGKIINPGQLTDTEKKIKSGLMVDTLNPITAMNQEARAALEQKTARTGLAPEVGTAVYNNLLGAQNATVLSQVYDVNNKAYGWVRDREDKQQETNLKSFETIMAAAIGTEGMQAALQYGADLGLDPAMLRAIAENPKAWATIADANRLALQQTNLENSTLFFEQHFDDYGDPEQVQANFAGWLDTHWNSDIGGLLAESAVANLTEADLASYKNAFGEGTDVTSEEGKAKVYAYREYNQALERMDDAATSEDVLSQLESMGYEMNSTTIKQVTDMVQGMSDAQVDVLMRDLNNGTGGSFTPESGAGSIYFFDWQGNPLTAGAKAPSEVDLLYNDAWIQYHKMSPNTTITRDEFKALLEAKGGDYTVDHDVGDGVGIAVDLMIDERKGSELKAFMDSEEGTAWWVDNVDNLSVPGSHDDGDNWSSGRHIVNTFKANGFVDGAMIEIGQGKYMVSGANPVRVTLVDSWDDSYHSEIHVIDMATGAVYWMPIGKHDQ